MSSPNLKLVNFSANSFHDWMNLHNDIVSYLNGQVYTNSVSDISTSNIATANAVNTVHSRALIANAYANVVYTLSNSTYVLVQSAYANSNTLNVSVRELSDYANSYAGWLISSPTQRYSVIPWVDGNGIVHLGTIIGFHSANSSGAPAANLIYDSANNLFEFSGGLNILNSLQIEYGTNTVLHISNGITDIIKIEANGNITGAVSGYETDWYGVNQLANSTIGIHQTANGVSIPVFDFHPALYANNSLTISLPKSWDQNNVSVRLYGIANSTTENSAVIIMKSRVIGGDELIFHDDSGTRLFCNSSATAANTLIFSDTDFTEINVTNKNEAGINNESLIHLSIYRDINDADDNLEVSFRLLGLKVKYGKRQLSDI